MAEMVRLMHVINPLLSSCMMISRTDLDLPSTIMRIIMKGAQVLVDRVDRGERHHCLACHVECGGTI
jgi:hypothetical protein